MELYTDAQLIDATQLPERQLRLLITWKGVIPTRGGRGTTRGWSRSAVRQIARIQVTYQAGLSLPVAHAVIAAVGGQPRFDEIDPDHVGGFTRPSWFAADEPLRPEDQDFAVCVADGRIVLKCPRPSQVSLVGHLNDDRSALVTHVPESVDAWRRDVDAATSILRINLSLACRVAMRRLLGIPVFFAPSFAWPVEPRR
ncbi:MAG: hypothetical protein K2X45_21755 [Phreatobacter sp.]|nr:hypothetical protein [Phreatobacter sp.]